MRNQKLCAGFAIQDDREGVEIQTERVEKNRECRKAIF